MEPLSKPLKLNPGDTITAITLSWGGAGVFPYRYQVGKQRLEEIFKLTIKPSRHALREPDWIYNNPEARADDLMEAFADPSIKGIFSIIGGHDSIRLLPFINYDTIKDNHKIFLGHSDNTVAHFICLKAGLGSFYGANVMTSFAENVQMYNYVIQGIQQTLFTNDIIGDIPQNDEGWTNQFLDWSKPSNQNIKRRLNPILHAQFISGEGKVRGRLIGGCLEVLHFIIGTEIWPLLSSWADTILFLETSEEGLSPLAVERILRNLGAQGILNTIKGILFSKPGGYGMKAETFQTYDTVLLRILKEYGREELPVVTTMDFGHTDPTWPIPYGCLAEINVETKKVIILENGVK